MNGEGSLNLTNLSCFFNADDTVPSRLALADDSFNGFGKKPKSYLLGEWVVFLWLNFEM